MKKLLWVITIVLLAAPAFAQDDAGGGFGGFDGTLSGADLDALFGGGGNRGNRGNNNNNNIPDPESMFLQLKDLLKVRKVPLSKDQEKSLRALLDTEIKSMRESLEAQFGNRGNNQNNQNNQNRQTNVLAELFKTVEKHNAELLTSMKTDLTPDQASLIAKAEKDKKVCIVMLDLVNLQQLQNRGGRGNNNNTNNNTNLPIGFDGFDSGGFDRGGRGYNNNNNNWAQQIPDRQFCTSGTSTTAERLAPVSQVLSKGKKPLTPEQEQKFSGLIDSKLTLMTEEFKSADPRHAELLNQINNQNRNNNNNNNPQQLRNNIVNTIMSQLGIPNNNNNNNNRGNRSGNNNPNNPNDPNNPNTNAAANNANANNANANNNNNAGRGNRGNNFNLQGEIQKKNEELLDKVTSSLNADQQPVIKKYKYDQIKARGGAERYRAILEQEGTPLTPEQLAQIQALFNGQNQAVRQYTEQLVQQELANAPPQPDPVPQPNQQQPQNRNQNNVNQNPLAQQIVAKLLPQVSVRRATLEKVTQETIMKLLTPPQVASYKINSL
jgi:hypothetical protein